MTPLDELERLAQEATLCSERDCRTRHPLANPDPIALDPTTVLDLIAKARLGEAWARAEAALPEGHHICAIERHCHVGDDEPGEFGVYTHDEDRWDGASGHGSTPEAALDALVSELEP